MIDGSTNSQAWEQHTGDILIFPVGAFEQHGRHLPLKTDVVNAEYAARALAEHFDAALLPALPIANSLEHSGTRGSFTLRPETLMQIVTDIAEEAERQNFRFLIVVSGHGGNFALIPACRAYNRLDHKLKILLVFAGEYASYPELESKARGIMDIHAGEVETSRFLAMGGQLVEPLPERPEEETAPDGLPWRRQDLTMVGIPGVNAEGYLGIPYAATKEKGEKLLKSMIDNLIQYLEDRMAKLRQQPRYCRNGGLAMRKLEVNDLPELLELSTAAGWNQRAEDWRFMLRQADGQALGFSHLGKIVATAVLMSYEQTKGWVGMVLVAPEWRGNHLATRLLNELQKRLGTEKSCKLDATPAGQKVYEKQDFRREIPLIRMTRRATVASTLPDGVQTMTPEGLMALKELDGASFRAAREPVLDYFYGTGAPAFMDGRGGYLLSRPGRLHRQLGPIYADCAADALRLVAAAMADGESLIMDVPESQSEFLDGLRSLGFQSMRPFVRMSTGPESLEELSRTFAIAGPEFG